jgi:hypothetical protein
MRAKPAAIQPLINAGEHGSAQRRRRDRARIQDATPPGAERRDGVRAYPTSGTASNQPR